MPRKTFTFTETELVTREGIAASAQGVVYSTSPRYSEDVEGRRFFTKGPDLDTVFAEIARLILADAVGLPTPSSAVCTFQGEKYAGSHEILGIRTVAMWIADWTKPCANREDLFSMIAVDTWLANTDRNMGNIVAASEGAGAIELVFIDFEKSVALRPFPTILSTQVNAKALWPVGDLGSHLRQNKPLHPPENILSNIEKMEHMRTRSLLQPIASAVPGVTWLEDCIAAVANRGTQIRRLLAEVWK